MRGEDAPAARGPNAPARIEARLRAGQLPRLGFASVVPARFVLALLAFLLVALVALAGGAPRPLTAAASWWMVSGTLVDVGCLVALRALVRREGIGRLDLLALDRRRVVRDLLLGLALVPALGTALAVVQVLQTLFYPGQLPPQVALVRLPAWATAYSVLVWPLVWATTEQLMYLGYLLPRLEVLRRRTALAAGVVTLFWSVQHAVLPFVPDAGYLGYRTLTTVPVAVTAIALYLFVLRRRLLPLVVVPGSPTCWPPSHRFSSPGDRPRPSRDGRGPAQAAVRSSLRAARPCASASPRKEPCAGWERSGAAARPRHPYLGLTRGAPRRVSGSRAGWLVAAVPAAGLGRCGISQSRKAPGLRVCSQTRPGPVNSATSPSPPERVVLGPPIRRTW